MKRRFALNPFRLIFLIPVYIGLRLLPPLLMTPAQMGLGVLALLIACALGLSGLRRRGGGPRWIERTMTWLGLLTLGFLSSLFAMTVLRDLFLFAVRFFVSSGQYAAWVGPSALWVFAAAVLATLIGFWMARGRPRVVDVSMPVNGLPRALHGFSIAQISDVHVGPTIRRGFVESLVKRVNALRADVVAVTGDLVDGSVEQLAPHTAPLEALDARHGAFFVTGNHEYYSGERAWTRELERLGLKVLKNQHVVLDHDGASVVLAGVTDSSAHHFDPAQRSDPAAAIRGAPVGPVPKILLAHQPVSAAAAARAGFDVQLSGHTHGGQFWPWNLLVRYFQPFTAGLYRLKQMMLYVNRGTGYWGPPNRFGVPPEITLIRLVPAGA